MYSRNENIIIPSECNDLVDLIGEDLAFSVVENFGGRRLYIPNKSAKRIPDILNEDALRALTDRFGGEYLKVPVARVWRVTAYRARGMSYDAIAHATHCSISTVHRILADHGLTGAAKEQV